MRQFEYKSIQGRLTEAQMNNLGDKGWELVTHSAILYGNEIHQASIWKREKAPKMEDTGPK